MTKKIPDLILGPLPVEVINKTLSHELEGGDVIFTSGAQKHSAARHPKDYPLCIPHIASIISAPLYLGDDFRNPGKIELVGRVLAGKLTILVAVCIVPDESGRYHVVSVYPVSEVKIEGRRARGHLKRTQK